MRYFRRSEAWGLNPFGYYCIVAGLGATAWLTFG
jgi:undecaprenyl-diphosphatase